MKRIKSIAFFAIIIILLILPKNITSADNPTKPFCGNGICETKLGENSKNCLKDCNKLPKPPAFPSSTPKTVGNKTSCGDGNCDSTETCSTCQYDCGSCSSVSVDNRFGGADVGRFAEETSEMGMGISRVWIQWGKIEPAEGRYNWTEMDAMVKNANDNGIDILGFFNYVPNWAKSNPSCTSDVCAIRDMNKFKNFAKMVAQRYDGNHGYREMKYIEILNEVTNGGNFFDIRNTNYQDWLINGYQGVKEGNPNAKVLIGGFVNPTHVPDFVTSMLRDYSQYYDIISYHVYESDRDVNDATVFLKEKMNAYGINKPIWITETATGFRYDEFPDVNDRIAEGVIKRFAMAFGNGVERVLWWPFVGLPTPNEYSGSGTSVKTLGLVWAYPKGSGMPIGEIHPRPAYNTYKLMTSKLSGFSSAIKITDTQYKFIVNGKNIYVLWCDSASCSIPSEIQGTVKITNYNGDEDSINVDQITLSSSPVFVESEAQTTICGNGYCDSTETCSTCQDDCGTCPISSSESRFSTQGAGVFDIYLDEAKEIGIENLRIMLDWKVIEPANDRYDWSRIDREVKAATESNIDLFGQIAYMPDWAKSDPNCEIPDGSGKPADFCEPINWDDWTDFLEKLVVRYNGNNYYCGEAGNEYCGKILFFEIQNEPTLFSGMDYLEYGEWLRRAYVAIKNANPETKVMTAGFVNPFDGAANITSPDEIQFIDKILQDYNLYFDIFDIHIYSEERSVTEGIKHIKERMEHFGINKPIWVSETSTGIIARSGSVERSAQDVVKRYSRAFSEGVEKVSYFAIIGKPLTTENRESRLAATWGSLAWSSFTVRDFNPRQAYYAYGVMTSKLAGFTTVTKISDTQYKYVVDGRNIYVLWCDAVSCSVPSEISGTVKVTDYLGNVETKDASQVVLDTSPLFIEETGGEPPTIVSFDITESNNYLTIYVKATDDTGIEKITLDSPAQSVYQCNSQVTCENTFIVDLSTNQVTGNTVKQKCGDGICDDKEKNNGICPNDCNGKQLPAKKPLNCLAKCKAEGKLPKECYKICGVEPPKVVKQNKKSILKYDNKEIKSKENVEVQEDKIFMQTKKGKKEVKIMPDTASLTALNKLTMKNVEIELKDVGKPVYNVKGIQKVKLLGIIPIEKSISVQIDAETGAVVKTSQSWWSFMAKDVEIVITITVTDIDGLSTTQTKTQSQCGNGICNDGETSNSCPSDCPFTQSCGNGNCDSGETCNSCYQDCGNCPTPSGESRFGIGTFFRQDLVPSVMELGDIYVGLGLGDAVGWKYVKGATVVDRCRSCCDPTISRTCSCEIGTFYYCTPTSREGQITGEALADTFYGSRSILLGFYTGVYGENEPRSISDLNSVKYPADEEEYKGFIRYLVQKYPEVVYWRVGNEADNPQFWGDTPMNYARLVALTAGEIKRQCPECKVGPSLVSPTPPNEWFDAIVSVCGNIDFLDLHQYQSNTMTKLKEFEQDNLARWKSSCPGVEIISLETGLPSQPVTFKGTVWGLGTTEERQAQDIIKYFTMMFNAGYNKIFNYLVDHDFVSGVPDIFESIGVLDGSGRKKVSFETYQIMIQKLDYFTSITKLADGQYKYTFADKDPVYVLWCDTTSCSVSSEIQGTVKVTDYLGYEETKDASQITLTSSPLFVEILANQVCGNGNLEGSEQCDDGNQNNQDECKNDCTNNICGDNEIQLPSQVCELPNTENNQFCQQSTELCLGSKLQIRDSTGNCNDVCGCIYDNFGPEQCVKNKCGADCSVDSDCNDNNPYTQDSCNLNSCGCVNTPIPDCGNSICDNNESCSSCSSDCGNCQNETGCTDTDGGLIYGVRGEVNGNRLSWNPSNTERRRFYDSCVDFGIGTYGQVVSSCSGSPNCKIDEYFCQNDIVYYRYVQCPNGCTNGACISTAECGNNVCDSNESCSSCSKDCGNCLDYCTDSDNGRDYYTRGHIEGSKISWTNDSRRSFDDWCINFNIGTNGQAVNSCNAQPNCKIAEYYCQSNTIYYQYVQCPNGCKNGLCIR